MANIIPKPIVNPKDCFTFSYTSGTTGNPKGAMLSHQNMVSLIAALINTDGKLLQTDIHISYLPLPHIFERAIVWNIIYMGANMVFFSGDVLKLKEDIQVIRPTFFASVPRIYNRFYGAMKKGLDELTGCKKGLANSAFNSKTENLHHNA